MKRLITSDKKGVTFDKDKQKQSAVAKPRLTIRNVFNGIDRESFNMSSFPTAKLLILMCTVNNWTI